MDIVNKVLVILLTAFLVCLAVLLIMFLIMAVVLFFMEMTGVQFS